MLHPLQRLASEPDGSLRLHPTGRRRLRPSVVVPRGLCAFESLSTQGVAWHEMGNFARLQAARLAPFVDSGANAVHKGKRLMFWFWDAAEVDDALRQAGLDPARTQVLAEPLMLPFARTPGTHRLQCSAGIDTLTIADGAIIASLWQDTRPPAAPLPWRGEPWGRDLLSNRAARQATADDRSLAQRALAASAVVAVIAAACQLAYWGGRVHSASERLAQQTEASTEASAALGRITELRRSERSHVAWLERYAQLGTGLDAPGLLRALTVPLEAQGTVVREFEVQGNQLRLLLVAAGGDLNVPGVLKALSAVPGVRAIQLQQNPDATQASFLMDIGSFRKPLPMVGTETRS